MTASRSQRPKSRTSSPRGEPGEAAGPSPAGRGEDGNGRSRRRLFKRLKPRPLKRYLPTSLYGRALLIIILPVALMQAAVTWVFFDAHWQTVTGRLSQGLAGEIAWAVETYEQSPTPQTLAAVADRAERTMDLSIALQEGRELPTTTR